MTESPKEHISYSPKEKAQKKLKLLEEDLKGLSQGNELMCVFRSFLSQSNNTLTWENIDTLRMIMNQHPTFKLNKKDYQEFWNVFDAQKTLRFPANPKGVSIISSSQTSKAYIPVVQEPISSQAEKQTVQKEDKWGDTLPTQTTEEIMKTPKNIQDLFATMQTIPELATEKGYGGMFESPIYTGDQYPAFVIIGDVHAGEDSYNKEIAILKDLGEDIAIGEIQMEWDEWLEPEINAVKKLYELGVCKVWIENEVSWDANFRSKIGQWLNELQLSWLHLVKLEDTKIWEKGSVLKSLTHFQKNHIIYNKINKDNRNVLEQLDFFDSTEEDSFTKELQNRGLFDLNIAKTYNEKSDISLFYDTFNKATQEDLVLMYKFLMYRDKDWIGHPWNFASFRRIIENDVMYKNYIQWVMQSLSISTKENDTEKDFSIQVSKLAETTLINERNISFLDKLNPGNGEVVGIVIGKGHEKRLFEQIQEKYPKGVNVYVAH